MWRKMKNRVFLVSVFKNYFMFLRIKNTKNAFGKGSGFCSQCFLYIYIYCLFVCLFIVSRTKKAFMFSMFPNMLLSLFSPFLLVIFPPTYWECLHYHKTKVNFTNTSFISIISVYIEVVFARSGNVRVILLELRNFLGKMLDLGKEKTW